MLLEHAMNRAAQAGEPVLQQIICGAVLHRLDGPPFARYNDDRQGVIALIEQLEDAPDEEAWVGAVGDHEIRLRRERIEERLLRFNPLPSWFEPRAAQLPEQEL